MRMGEETRAHAGGAYGHLDPSILGGYRSTTVQTEWVVGAPARHLPTPGVPVAVHVRDVMTRKVISIARTATLTQAVEALNKHCITGMPVLDEEGRPVGVLSEKDILRTLRETVGLSYPKTLWDLLLRPEDKEREELRRSLLKVLESTKVQHAMNSPAFVIGPEVTVHDALRTMVGRGVHRLVVVEDAKMVGIVTRRDIMASLIPEA